MKIKFLIFGIILLLLTTFLSGCDELENVLGESEKIVDYIVVTVNAPVCVYNKTTEAPLVGEPVRIQIIKAGGERFDEVLYTDVSGCTSAAISFKVYNKQTIDAYAYPVNHPYVFDEYHLPWEVIKADRIQGAYSWYVPFALFV